jgi:hypothetical protein
MRLFAATLLITTLAAPVAAQVPTPTVTGPIAGVAPGDASRNYPFYASLVDLRAQGYVEEEFIEGTASHGTFAVGGPQGAPASGQPAANGGCDRPPYSHVPFHHVMNAAFDHLVRWVKDGTPPPSAPPIELTSVSPAVAARDARGNALGGIRQAEHAVPTAVNTGLNTGAGFCRLYGSHEPFDAATLATLYPTRAAYVDAVRRVTGQNLKARYILKTDADATIAAAERSAIGTGRESGCSRTPSTVRLSRRKLESP